MPLRPQADPHTSIELQLRVASDVVSLEPGGFSLRLLAANLITAILFLGFGSIPAVVSPNAPAAMKGLFFAIAACTWLALAALLVSRAARFRSEGPVCVYDLRTRRLRVPIDGEVLGPVDILEVRLVSLRIASRSPRHTHITHARQARLLVRTAAGEERTLPIAMNPFPKSALRRFAAAVGARVKTADAGEVTPAAWERGDGLG